MANGGDRLVEIMPELVEIRNLERVLETTKDPKLFAEAKTKLDIIYRDLANEIGA